MSTFYTLYSLTLDSDVDIVETFRSSVKNTSLVLLIPYACITLYFSWQDKIRRLEILAENSVSTKNEVISFHDEKGEFRFSIKKDTL